MGRGERREEGVKARLLPHECLQRPPRTARSEEFAGRRPSGLTKRAPEPKLAEALAGAGVTHILALKTVYRFPKKEDLGGDPLDIGSAQQIPRRHLVPTSQPAMGASV
jgi:hypothetical protein